MQVCIPVFLEFQHTTKSTLLPSFSRVSNTRIFRQHSRMYRSVRLRSPLGTRLGSRVSVAILSSFLSDAIREIAERTSFNLELRQRLQR